MDVAREQQHAAGRRQHEGIGRAGFYVLFACAVTISVQLVGLYLVFTSLIVPPLGTRRLERRRLSAAWALGAAGYAVGLGIATVQDWPPGPTIVWTMVCLAGLFDAITAAIHARRSAVDSAQ